MKQTWVCNQCDATYTTSITIREVSCAVCTKRKGNKLQWMQLDTAQSESSPSLDSPQQRLPGATK